MPTWDDVTALARRLPDAELGAAHEGSPAWYAGRHPFARYREDAGREIVYPASLPKDWIATSVDFQPGQETTWGVGMLTRAGTFVGVRQEDDSLDDLLATYVDDDPDEITELPAERFEGSVATQWQVFEDEGGDRAYAAEVGEEWVLVYGSAELLDLREVVDRLTTEPVA